jgi:hypothetical protein
VLFKGPLKEYIAAHDGQLPDIDNPIQGKGTGRGLSEDQET